jgi:hypothetical protein
MKKKFFTFFETPFPHNIFLLYLRRPDSTQVTQFGEKTGSLLKLDFTFAPLI